MMGEGAVIYFFSVASTYIIYFDISYWLPKYIMYVLNTQKASLAL